MSEPIPFNKPYYVGTETEHLEAAVRSGWISAGGDYTQRCERWLESNTGSARALITTSCTSAMEAATLLTGLGPGDEVIMPSFTFVTTASAPALRGATPVFVDIREDTLNIDESLIEDAITPATKAIWPVHYAGIACEMDAITGIAGERGLDVVEDAAQGIMAKYKGRALGSIGDFGALSFHETKNVTCGEGGALLIKDPELAERAEIVWEKGTNRTQFKRGEVDRYTWLELGSSLGLGEVGAAFLFAQLEHAEEITKDRLATWGRYHEAFAEAEAAGAFRRPVVPEGCEHSAHMYYLLLNDPAQRPVFISALLERGVSAVFHYVPLHDSPAGSRLGRAAGNLDRTEDLSGRLVRLPLWAGMDEPTVQQVIDAVLQVAPTSSR